MRQSAAAMSAPASKAPNPPPAAILAATPSLVSSRADDGGRVGRLCAAKAVRMTSAASVASAVVKRRSAGASAFNGARSVSGEEKAMAVAPLHVCGPARQGLGHRVAGVHPELSGGGADLLVSTRLIEPAR